MSRMLSNFLFQKPVPVLWQVALWLIGSFVALKICYARPGEIVQVAMFIAGLLFLAIWYRYTQIAAWTQILNSKSVALKFIAVAGSVLLVSASVLMTPGN